MQWVREIYASSSAHKVIVKVVGLLLLVHAAAAAANCRRGPIIFASAAQSVSFTFRERRRRQWKEKRKIYWMIVGQIVWDRLYLFLKKKKEKIKYSMSERESWRFLNWRPKYLWRAALLCSGFKTLIPPSALLILIVASSLLCFVV